MSPDIFFLRKALEVARQSKEKGNLPFGCILVSPDNTVLLEGENTVISDNDSIAHCEINLVHQVAGKFTTDYLERCTVYASTEPCPMCTAAIFWSGIGKLVFALSKDGYHSVANTTNPAHLFDMPAKELLKHGGRRVTVIGPVMEEEAKALYREWL